MDPSDKLPINLCSYEDLLGLPYVGKAIADKIWAVRKNNDITPEILAAIPHVRMNQIHHLIDYTTVQEYSDFIERQVSENQEEENEPDNLEYEDTVLER